MKGLLRIACIVIAALMILTFVAGCAPAAAPVTVTATVTQTLPAAPVTVTATVTQTLPAVTVTATATTTQPTETNVTIDGKVLLSETGKPIVLKNNPKAADVAWTSLRDFLLKDDTDNIQSIPGQWGYIDFATRLHNNAEVAGIRCAFVVVTLGPSAFFAEGTDYYLNAFETPDLGTVYIDDVSFNMTTNQDKIIDAKVTNYYIPKGVLATPVGPPGYQNFGKILQIKLMIW
jgi:hypothetical protein